MVTLSSASLFPGRKWETATQGGNMGIDHTIQKKKNGASIVKGLEVKQETGHILDTFTLSKTNKIT